MLLPPDPLNLQLALAVRTRDLNRVVELAWRLYRRPLLGMAKQAGVPAQEFDDFVQDVFAVAIRGWPDFRGDNFRGWLFTLAWYQTRTWRGAQARAVAFIDSDSTAEAVTHADPEADLDAQRVIALVLRVVEGCTLIEQIIFRGQVLGHGDTEIVDTLANELGVTLTNHAVVVRWGRVRAKLRLALQAHGPP